MIPWGQRWLCCPQKTCCSCSYGASDSTRRREWDQWWRIRSIKLRWFLWLSFPSLTPCTWRKHEMLLLRFVALLRCFVFFFICEKENLELEYSDLWITYFVEICGSTTHNTPSALHHSWSFTSYTQVSTVGATDPPLVTPRPSQLLAWLTPFIHIFLS